MSDDTISRKATIDAMENVDWYHISKDGRLVHGANSDDHEPLYKAKDVYAVLNTMSSAQAEERTEERTETHSCDLISRQAAIESIRECAEAAHSMHDWDMEQGYLNAIECIEEEPSAQPEIVLCKDCKHKGTKNCVANAWTTIFGVMVKDDFYCGLAERRTDERSDKQRSGD